eukprot:GHVP01065898.1.p1 GENE.GHVP01065898.1~~GHVP01065898.1.p1  ORF type:complete len:114 (-),score=15.58 GHVP01065898.1:123-464(-)
MHVSGTVWMKRNFTPDEMFDEYPLWNTRPLSCRMPHYLIIPKCDCTAPYNPEDHLVSDTESCLSCDTHETQLFSEFEPTPLEDIPGYHMGVNEDWIALEKIGHYLATQRNPSN